MTGFFAKNLIKGVVLLSIFICMSAVLATAQDQQQAAEEAFKKQLEIIEGHYKNIEERHKVKIENLDERFKVLENQIDARVKKAEFIYDLITGFLGPITIAGVFLGVIGIAVAVWRLYVVAKQIANDKAKEIVNIYFDDAFERLIDVKKEKIRRIMELYDEEAQLKKSKAIVVLNDGSATDSFAMHLITRMNFENRRHERFKVDVIFRGEDLLLIDDQDGRITEEDIIRLVRRAPENMICFYFGSKRISTDDETAKRFAFSNVRFQLYGNVINALRYQDLLIA